MLVAHARARRGPGMRVSAGIQARSPRLTLTLFEPDGALMGHCNSKQRRAYQPMEGDATRKKATVGFRVMIERNAIAAHGRCWQSMPRGWACGRPDPTWTDWGPVWPLPGTPAARAPPAGSSGLAQQDAPMLAPLGKRAGTGRLRSSDLEQTLGNDVLWLAVPCSAV